MPNYGNAARFLDTYPAQSPEGILIEKAREKTGLSLRGAAARCGLSYATLKNAEAGYTVPVTGKYLPYRCPPLTLAKLAAGIGLDAAELEAAGRDDAALLLQAGAGGQPELPSEPSPTAVTPHKTAFFFNDEELLERARQAAAADRRSLSNWVVVTIERALDSMEAKGAA